MLIYLLLIIGFILLVKGADFLVEGASSIARKVKVSDLVIGLTIVAFGTSAPELFVNIVSSIKGNAGIAVGNILGSNIANILLVLGICAIIAPLKVGKGTVWKEIPFCLLAALLLGVLANDFLIDKKTFSELSKSDGLTFLAFFIIFMSYTFSIAKQTGIAGELPEKQFNIRKAIFLVIVGLFGLSFGGKLIVDNAMKIALRFGMSETLIGLTIVAIGTTLPEVATSVVAVYKGKVELAVGNIVGSNIFNIFLVLGVSAVIKPLPFNVTENFSVILMILASFFLFLAMFVGRKRVLDRWVGVIFVILYLGYISFLIVTG